MKNLSLIILAALVSAGASVAQKINIPDYTREKLSNGLVVLLMEYRKLPLIEMRLTLTGGSAFDPAGKEGSATMVAALLDKGTSSRTAAQIAQQIDFIGGNLNASASRDFITVTCEVQKKDLGTGMDLFADIILKPAFADDEVDRERKQALAALEDLKDDPGRVASLYFAKVVYGKHPYGHQSGGTKASLEAMKAADVRAFYQQAFIPSQGVLTLVGDFESDKMLALVKQTFGKWKKGTPLGSSVPAPARHTGRTVVIVNKPDLTQTQIRIGNTGVTRSNPDYFAIQVANSILGNGFTSRLVDEIRVKRSLTYGAGSGFGMGLFGGTYQISTFTKNATAREVIDVALNEVKKFRDAGAGEEELAKAHNYLAGDFARDLQAPEALAANITEIELYKLPKNFLQTYIERLNSVSLGDVKRVVNTYFHYEDLLIVAVTNQAEVQPSLESLGKIRTVDFQKAVE